MLCYLILICCLAGPVEMVYPSRQGYNSGMSPVRSSLEVHGLSRYPHGAPAWEAEAGEERQARGPSPIESYPKEKDGAIEGRPNQRTGNWCSFMNSRIVTFVASCKTEKYVIRSQQACPSGSSECQRVMYRVALKPVYQVKQKVLTSVDWKCCSGYTGSNCQYNDPNAILIPAIHLSGRNRENPFPEENTPSVEPAELFKSIQDQESTLLGLQNDVHQATSNLVDLQSLLESNITSRIELNETNTVFQENMLQQVLLPYIEKFLRQHFNPIWTSFNKSLQNLSNKVQNLSENVELNMKNIEKFQLSTAPKKDLQELGTKFESKIQGNIAQLDQLKQDIEDNYYSQQSSLYYNVTTLKADIDMKLKRNQKIHQAQISSLNDSIEVMKRAQETLQDEIQALNRNITELWLYCGTKEMDGTQENIRQLNETLDEHMQQIKDLYQESDATYENINTLEKWFKELRTQFKNTASELQVSLIEKSLIMEEIKVALQRQLMELNYTVINLQESNEDLLSYIKNCDCRKLMADLEMLEQDQQNLTSVFKDVFRTLSELKQKDSYSQNTLQNSVEDLSMALHPIQQTLVSQQEQNRNIMQSISQLTSEGKIFTKDVSLLRKADEAIHVHIKNLDSSFSSLLQDGIRHERVLEALLGDEIMEALSEEQPEALTMSIFQVHEALIGTTKELGKQQISIDSLTKRIEVLEMQSETQSDSPEMDMPSNFGKPTKSTNEEFKGKHTILEHMEPSHEAARTDQLDYASHSDILALKKDVKELGMQMKKLETHCAESSVWFNQSIVRLTKPLNSSLVTLNTDMISLKQHVEDHVNLLKRLFKNTQALVASNTSLDMAKIHSVIAKQIRKQQRMEKQPHRRGVKHATEQEYIMADFSENNLDWKPHETGTSVAFYAGFSEGDNETSILHFNELYLNYGNGYFLEDGQFKAPHQGVYSFIITVEFGPGPAIGQLVLGSQGKVPLRKGNGADGSTMSNFAIVELTKGEMVWFELVHGSVVKRSPPGSLMGGYLIFKT